MIVIFVLYLFCHIFACKKTRHRGIMTSSPRHHLEALAMPTLVATPCPSGPVVISTPPVSPNSGWPGQREPNLQRKQIPAGHGRSMVTIIDYRITTDLPGYRIISDLFSMFGKKFPLPHK